LKRLVIDCDPGIDDAQAIMMAYVHPEVKIEAVTSVSGNADVKQTKNLRRRCANGIMPVYIRG